MSGMVELRTNLHGSKRPEHLHNTAVLIYGQIYSPLDFCFIQLIAMEMELHLHMLIGLWLGIAEAGVNIYVESGDL